MGGWGLIFQNCTGSQRLQGSRGCPGFGTVTAAPGSLWSSVYTQTGDRRVAAPTWNRGEEGRPRGLTECLTMYHVPHENQSCCN